MARRGKRWLAAAALLLVLGLHPLPAPAEEPLRAAVLERPSAWTKGAGGAARLLKEAGFEVGELDLKRPPTAQGVYLLVFGSFCSESPDYRCYVKAHADALRAFVEGGGVICQFTQADQTESRVPFLAKGMRVVRCDEDLDPIFVVDGTHPLLAQMPREKADETRLALERSFGRPANWESICEFEGVRVLARSEAGNRRPAIVEAAHGKGRIVITSLHVDALYGKDGSLVAPASQEKAGKAFAAGLLRWTALVREGRAPQVVPSKPWALPPPLLFVEGSFTLAVLPDTQIYAQHHPAHFERQCTWIRDHAKQYNIKYVLHLGDITNRNTPEQWQVAKDALAHLEGVVPYALAPGNHDYGRGGSAADRTTRLNDYFSAKRCATWPTFGGVMEQGKLDNSYHVFEAGGHRYLILALEWGPRKQAVAWANRIAREHPGRRIILITHAYMYFDETRYDWARKGRTQAWNPHAYGSARGRGGTHDGEELWSKLVSRHAGFIMTLNGHVLGDGLGRLTSWGDKGNAVHQMLVNYQMKHEGGEGFMRLLEFLPDGETIQVKAWSPSLKTWKTDPQNQFVLKLGCSGTPR